MTMVLWVLLWALLAVLALIGMLVVGLVLVAQTMPRMSTGTFLSDPAPPPAKPRERRPGKFQWRP